MIPCKSAACVNLAQIGCDFCHECVDRIYYIDALEPINPLSEKYPQYYKAVGDMTEIDVYAVHHLFDIQDPSGAIQHASKKLLLSGVRTGGKSAHDDIKEARDTLSRWLQLNPECVTV